MSESAHYVIRGGVEGRERLRLLGRIMHASTSALFDRVGVHDGLSCLDIGCGGGDVTLELARRVGPRGRVIGGDIDATKLELARGEAAQQGFAHVSFATFDVCGTGLDDRFDVVYSRFLLTHLSDPASAVAVFHRHVRPGGTVAVEDIDFSGYFTYPESRAFQRYHALYCATVSRRGGDPNIGPRLPGLLERCGFRDVEMAAVQPLATRGDVKLISAVTMQNIAGAVLEDGLATQDEIDTIVHELYEFAADPTTVAGTPRVIQAWGRRAAA
jgi:SAM-dependent methyltransferase